MIDQTRVGREKLGGKGVGRQDGGRGEEMFNASPEVGLSEASVLAAANQTLACPRVDSRGPESKAEDYRQGSWRKPSVDSDQQGSLVFVGSLSLPSEAPSGLLSCQPQLS